MVFIIGIAIGIFIGSSIYSHYYNKDLCKTCKHCLVMGEYRRYGDNKCIFTDSSKEICNRGDKITICRGYERRDNNNGKNFWFF